jgi:pimeloyl-ACP methyl ester carboxylesterase
MLLKDSFRMSYKLASILLLLSSVMTPFTRSQSASLSTAQSKAREIEVTFRSGETTLAGTLLLPESSVPVAAIVITHGSGPQTRQESMPFAERFVRDGFAVLAFDKRGSGSSDGRWYATSLDDLADDAIAAAAFLKSRAEIDGKRIGIFGVSQAGWVNPHAVVRAPGVFAFAVIVTGGGVRPIEVEKYDYNATLEHAQATVEDRREAMALVDRYMEYLKTGEGRVELESAIEASSSKPWAKVVNLSRVMPLAADRSKWEWVPTYDPTGDIAQIHIPVLVLLGSRDRFVQSEIAEERWRTSLIKAANPDAAVFVFIGGGHGLTVGEHHLDTTKNEYVSGYLEILDSWLRLHGTRAL